MAVWVEFQCYESVTIQLCFLGMTSAIKNHEIPTCTTLNQGWVVDFRWVVDLNQHRRKLPQNIVQFVICHLHNIWPWKRAHCPSKKGSYILHMLHKNFTCWKQFKFLFCLEVCFCVDVHFTL